MLSGHCTSRRIPWCKATARSQPISFLFTNRSAVDGKTWSLPPSQWHKMVPVQNDGPSRRYDDLAANNNSPDGLIRPGVAQSSRRGILKGTPLASKHWHRSSGGENEPNHPIPHFTRRAVSVPDRFGGPGWFPVSGRAVAPGRGCAGLTGGRYDLVLPGTAREETRLSRVP